MGGHRLRAGRPPGPHRAGDQRRAARAQRLHGPPPGRAGRPCSSRSPTRRRPCPRRGTTAPDATTGRGIALVEALSAAWGVQSSPTGKTVWCRVRSDDQLPDFGRQRRRGAPRSPRSPAGRSRAAAHGVVALALRGVSEAGSEELVTVQIIGLPTALQVRGPAAHRRDHPRADAGGRADAADAATSDGLPVRFVELVSSAERPLRDVHRGAGGAAHRGHRRRRPDRRPDLHRARVGRGRAGALGGILDEADEYCRQGRLLLTLATPAPLVAYRQWFLDQFVDQAAGAPPVAWADYRAADAGPVARSGSRLDAGRLLLNGRRPAQVAPAVTEPAAAAAGVECDPERPGPAAPAAAAVPGRDAPGVLPAALPLPGRAAARPARSPVVAGR